MKHNNLRVHLACLALEHRLVEHNEMELYDIVIEESVGRADILLQHRNDKDTFTLMEVIHYDRN